MIFFNISSILPLILLSIMNSRYEIAILASPFELFAIFCNNFVSYPELIFLLICFKILRISFSFNIQNRYNFILEIRALLREYDGFSVVVPISITEPSSIWGRNASCCILLNLCISSINMIV